MRVPVAIALILLPAAAQAQFMPRSSPASTPLPGIVDTGTRPAGPSPARDLADTRERIGDAQKRGELSKREARALRREARQIDALADRYGADGLSDSERRELDLRTQALRSLTNAQRKAKP